MAELNQLYDALRKADAAGNVEDAQALSAAIASHGKAEIQSQPMEQVSQGLGFYKGLTRPLDNAAQWLDAGAKKIGIDMDGVSSAIGLPTAAQAAQSHKDYITGQQNAGITPGGLGQFAGSIVGTLPAVAVTKNPFIGGGIAGALDSDKKDLRGVATDAALGALLGKAGDTAVRSASGLIAPKVSKAVRTLVDAQVPLTIGQIKGGAVKRAEDAATSIPFVGDVVKSAQNRSLEAFNRAAINRTLAPINKELPTTTKVGTDGVDYAAQALGDAYGEVLPRLTFEADKTYTANVGNLLSLAKNIPQYGAKPLRAFIQTEISPRMSAAGKMSGESFKEVDSKLGREIAEYSRSLNPNDRKLADGFRELQSQLRRSVERANPADAPKLKAIDRGYANLVRVENAAGRTGATGGVFTPAQLQGAVRAADNSVRKRSVARGRAMMQDLSSAGKEVLPSSVADSGTATRGLLAYLAGGGAAHFVDPAAGAGMLGILGAYTKPGQKIATGLLARKPSQAEQQLADLIAHLRGPAALTGSAVLANSRADVSTP